MRLGSYAGTHSMRPLLRSSRLGSVTLIVANLNVLVALAFRHGADDKETAPAPLEVKSIVTFGQGDPRRKRSKFGGNVLNATLLATQNDEASTSTMVMLDTMKDHSESYETGNTTKYSSQAGAGDPTMSSENVQRVTWGSDKV
ncbi:hypothetical protein EVJ58_g4610 [Rhodofomes roseus]|uniref:Uncharacterized protein n=1 Tax=Rhodofomes roseus TaxID=34475 RepID=A0A4Y9YH11_9APHY|nr:hypothetical protein EVJ58_g4610 [Rhodofomes roseus]